MTQGPEYCALVLVTEVMPNGQRYQTTVEVYGISTLSSREAEDLAVDAYVASGGRITPSEREAVQGTGVHYIYGTVLYIRLC